MSDRVALHARIDVEVPDASQAAIVVADAVRVALDQLRAEGRVSAAPSTVRVSTAPISEPRRRRWVNTLTRHEDPAEPE